MKVDKNALGIIVAATALVGYIAIDKKRLAAKKIADDAANEAKKETPTPGKKAAPKPNAAEKTFINAVIELQNALNVSPPTGFVGSKTKQALQDLKLTTAVTAANVSDLITKVKAAKAAKPTATKNLASQALNLYKKLSTSKISLLRDLELTPKVLNKLTNKYIDIPGSYTDKFYKGHTWKHDQLIISAATTSDKVVGKTPSGKTYIIPADSILISS